MVSITPELKEAFNLQSRYIDYEIVWSVANLAAQESAIVEADEEPEISRISQVMGDSGILTPFASFEKNGFPLDGSVYVPPKASDATSLGIGLVMPVLSNENGVFDAAQVLTITLSEKLSWIGFTLDFGAVPAMSFTIDYYEDDTVKYSTSVTDTETYHFLDKQTFENCNKIVISITKVAMPFHRARVFGATIGIVYRYNKGNCANVRFVEQFDPLNERVPTKSLEFEVDNFSADYNIFDPSDVYKFLRQRQRVDIKVGALKETGQLEYVNCGRFYLSKPELRNNMKKIRLNTTGRLGIMSNVSFPGTAFGTHALSSIVDTVSSLTGVVITYPSWLSSVTIQGYVPTLTCTEVLRRISQVAGLYLIERRNGSIELKEPSNSIEDCFTPQDYTINTGLSVSDDSIINTVTVNSYKYNIDTTVSKLGEVIGAGTHHVKYNPSAEHTATIDGGTIISATYYADNAIITITGGTVTINGKRLIETVSEIRISNAQEGDNEIEYMVKNNNLITPALAESVAIRYLGIRADKRRVVKMQYRGYPYIEIGDVVSFDTGNYTTNAFVVCKNSLNLGGGMVGSLEAKEEN